MSRPDHECPLCHGDGCLPCDNEKGKHHCTKPCPITVGCNGSGRVSDYKYRKILSNIENGYIICGKCGKKYKVEVTE
jgi:uncharacterized protein YbaR (Trm112 family)